MLLSLLLCPQVRSCIKHAVSAERLSKKPRRITNDAKALLRVAAESYMIALFADFKKVMENSTRGTLFAKDMEIAKTLRGRDDNRNVAA